MTGEEFLAQRFEADRAHLHAVAYRMLGSAAEADDAVQEAWLRLRRADTSGVVNLAGWLTTVVARVCLDMLRSRRSRREEPLAAEPPQAVPGPVVSPLSTGDPEGEALLADSVGLALLVVLDTLAPAERLAFVLHDMFAVPFEEIAAILARSPAAARQLASRARRRVQAASPALETDLARQRAVTGAWLAASRDGDFGALVALLDPDAVLRADLAGGTVTTIRGAHAIVSQAATFAHLAPFAKLALVNGRPGIVAAVDGRARSVMAFTVRNGTITEIGILADPRRLARVDTRGL